MFKLFSIKAGCFPVAVFTLFLAAQESSAQGMGMYSPRGNFVYRGMQPRFGGSPVGSSFQNPWMQNGFGNRNPGNSSFGNQSGFGAGFGMGGFNGMRNPMGSGFGGMGFGMGGFNGMGNDMGFGMGNGFGMGMGGFNGMGSGFGMGIGGFGGGSAFGIGFGAPGSYGTMSPEEMRRFGPNGTAFR